MKPTTQYPFFKSPNFDNRVAGANIKILVLHYTVIDFAATKNTFLNPKAKVSSHYVVDTDGSIYQFVEESKRAWHAGVSFFDGIKDVNGYSIGIEIVNPGYDPAKYPITPYPAIQIKSVVELSLQIVSKYNIKPYCVVGHSDISPARKIDPGPHFPWQAISEKGLGIFPTDSQIDKQDPSKANVEKLLDSYGYTVANLEQTKKTFQLHYNPKAWINGDPFSDYDKKVLMALFQIKKG